MMWSNWDMFHAVHAGFENPVRSEMWLFGPPILRLISDGARISDVETREKEWQKSDKRYEEFFFSQSQSYLEKGEIHDRKLDLTKTRKSQIETVQTNQLGWVRKLTNFLNNYDRETRYSVSCPATVSQEKTTRKC